MSKMSSQTVLPNELLLEIFSYVDQRGYATLCLVSRLLHHIAEPCLYKSVRLIDGRGKPFMSTIKQRPDLAPYIENVTVHYTTEEASGCAIAPLLATFHNLREFHLQSGYWHWNEEDLDISGVAWDDEQTRLCEFFEKNSLLTADELRILPAFTTCKQNRDHSQILRSDRNQVLLNSRRETASFGSSRWKNAYFQQLYAV